MISQNLGQITSNRIFYSISQINQKETFGTSFDFLELVKMLTFHKGLHVRVVDCNEVGTLAFTSRTRIHP